MDRPTCEKQGKQTRGIGINSRINVTPSDYTSNSINGFFSYLYGFCIASHSIVYLGLMERVLEEE